MNLNILSINPKFFISPLNNGLIKKAIDKKIVNFIFWNLFDFIKNKKKCDGKIYGGGPGLLLRPEPLFNIINRIKKKNKNSLIIYLSPQGNIINNKIIKKVLNYNSLIIICGRYNGIDQRIIDKYIDIEISIGDYILSCGEISALVLIDIIIRRIPGVLNNYNSLKFDSFSFFNGLLGYPNYTRPKIFNNLCVPKVLFSGNHKNIFLWRFKKAFYKTLLVKPYLLKYKLLNKK